MAKSIPEQDLKEIEAVVSSHPEGIGIQAILNALEASLPRRTLQYRLKHLVEAGRLIKTGEKRWVRYMPARTKHRDKVHKATREELTDDIPVSRKAAEIQKVIRKPVRSRKPVGYERTFLNRYRPNHTAYLAEAERAHLRKIGTLSSSPQPAGTYAKQILNRLLIDLSWNSSRLEGNTYSLLDTKRLIAFGEAAEGKAPVESQMILNHKDAIEFLVGSANDIGFNRYTILNLHALLANNLLADPEATGRLRRIAVGIEQSAFHPLEVPQLIEEYFDQILSTAEAITDPFEQAFFTMVQLPYLQPFDDVNKRVSRLAANIPLIKKNLTPLSFIEVPAKTYTEAMLGVYELNQIDLLKDVFIWAYERSAARYAAVRQSLGEPDPFRLKYRSALREIVRTIVLDRLDKKAAFHRIFTWTSENIDKEDQPLFRETAENEVLSLHAGNFARYQIRPSQFSAWQNVWGMKKHGHNKRGPFAAPLETDER